MDAEKTGKLIEEARKAKGMTQAMLAEQIHVSNTAVSKYEHGVRFPDLSVLESLADVLDLTVSELIRGERQEITDEQEQAVRDIVREAGIQNETNTLRRSRRITLAVIGVILVVLLAAWVQLWNHPVLTRQAYTETNAAYEMTSPAVELVLYRRTDSGTQVQRSRLDTDPRLSSCRFLQISVTDEWLQWTISEQAEPIGEAGPETRNIPMTWKESVRVGKNEKLLGIDTAHEQAGTFEEIRDSGNYDVLVTVRMPQN
ncbi:MAG: helix-turn-helix transcriptional regulator [Solobacterium sp.]|nr:helix-turn-helix transcriptional regulator [Solobacterium sp.]